MTGIGDTASYLQRSWFLNAMVVPHACAIMALFAAYL